MRGKSVMEFYESEDLQMFKPEEPYYTIVYSMSHRKIMQLAQQAGAIYRMDSTVLINRDIFDAYLEQFREKAPHELNREG